MIFLLVDVSGASLDKKIVCFRKMAVIWHNPMYDVGIQSGVEGEKNYVSLF